MNLLLGFSTITIMAVTVNVWKCDNYPIKNIQDLELPDLIFYLFMSISANVSQSTYPLVVLPAFSKRDFAYMFLLPFSV